ncbi:hypothetical protein IMCC3317_07880 [Kordia antarctica]|uniref:Sulfotransferase family protein n=1 Tax=Kordia antarctica TaxID=1218801 RepID=A0A7L4ZFJ3_9FLAO|nr:sulfotransferase family 2 domain-containing protein [Kordia antarctica]QHI35442.1 hypothetical protein IMCC3317_07880 [Kordia antarctica]
MLTPNKLPFIFLHVPRTGGVSMSKILYPFFKPEERYVVYVEEEGGNSRNAVQRFIELPQAEKEKIKFIGGHAYFGLHEYYSNYSYFTLLRNPVDRIISIYGYALGWEGHYLHDQIIANRWSLHEFVESKISTELDNAMVRMLSGSYDIPFGKCTEELLEKAKTNLTKFFPTFGITERFTDTVTMLNITHGMRIHLHDKKKHNVAKVVLAPEQTTDEVKNFIKKTNALDYKLYEYACQVFEERISKNKEAFDTEINRLKTVATSVEKNQNSTILKYFVPLQKWYHRIFKS